MKSKEFLFGEEKDHVIKPKKDKNFYSYFKSSKDFMTEYLYNKSVFSKTNYENDDLHFYPDTDQNLLNLTNPNSDQIQDNFNHNPAECKEYIPKTEKKPKQRIEFDSSNNIEESNEKYSDKSSYSDSKKTISKSTLKPSLEKETNSFHIQADLKRNKAKNNKNKFYSIVYKSCLLLSLAMFMWDFYMKYKECEIKLEIQRSQWKLEYSLNRCDIITVEDSPIIYDYCQKKRINIETSTILLFQIFIELVIETINIFSYRLTIKSILLVMICIVLFYKVLRKND